MRKLIVVCVLLAMAAMVYGNGATVVRRVLANGRNRVEVTTPSGNTHEITHGIREDNGVIMHGHKFEKENDDGELELVLVAGVRFYAENDARDKKILRTGAVKLK